MTGTLPAEIAAIFNPANLPSLGPEPHAGALDLDTCQNHIETTIAGNAIGFTSAKLIRAAALLWHDHLEESHNHSQDIRDSDGSFLHGIMHRREPDYSNAKYWFNHTDDHPSFPQIARRVAAKGADGLIPVDSWDAFAMVDAVTKVAQNPSAENYKLLQMVQQIELEVLVEQFCGQARPT